MLAAVFLSYFRFKSRDWETESLGPVRKRRCDGSMYGGNYNAEGEIETERIWNGGDNQVMAGTTEALGGKEAGGGQTVRGLFMKSFCMLYDCESIALSHPCGEKCWGLWLECLFTFYFMGLKSNPLILSQ